ncbi:M15 family metallopeptidase [Streptomyces sp. NPDC059853]|uniref:M15 family metallopeptidase n=1 Tax=Streptomyces sp. NPDC059853 TaxID=3346973 RepID=UPI003657A532
MRRSPAALATLAVAGAALVLPLSGSQGRPPVTDTAPAGFVALRTIAPDIEEEMRYAGAHNFTGEPVDGYEEPVCLLTREAAEALGRAAAGLRERGYRLRVYDCYRPQRAVDHFTAWMARPEDGRTRAAFYPRVPKDRLVEEGYLAVRSGHSRGSTVDLTLVRAADGTLVDMGTGFDFFDPRSHGDSREVPAGARAARRVLADALDAEGFAPVSTEWWHFGYRDEPYPETYFDFPVSTGALAR